MNTNEHIVRITGGFSVEAPLEIDQEYKVAMPVDVFSAEMRSNQDGTFNKHYKAKVSGMVTLVKGDKMIRAKSKGSYSQKMRGAVYHRGHDYDEFMGWLMAKKLDGLFYEYETENN